MPQTKTRVQHMPADVGAGFLLVLMSLFAAAGLAGVILALVTR